MTTSHQNPRKRYPRGNYCPTSTRLARALGSREGHLPHPNSVLSSPSQVQSNGGLSARPNADVGMRAAGGNVVPAAVHRGGSRRTLKTKKKHAMAQAKKISVDDEVVEIFRFPSLVLPGVDAQVRDSTWTISLYDTMASAEDNASISKVSSVLVLRGIKLSGNHMTVLPVRMATLKHIVALADEGDSTIGGGGGDGEDYPDEFSEAGQLQEVFERMQDGVRAYRALGLLRGDTRLATQLANRLLTRLRVTKDMKFVVHFEETEEAKIAASLDEVATGANRGVEILEAEEQAEAATRIQAVVRGKQTRRSQADSETDGIINNTPEGEKKNAASANESNAEDGSRAPDLASEESRTKEDVFVATTTSNAESNLGEPLLTGDSSEVDVNHTEAEPVPIRAPEAEREPDAENENPLDATSESVSEHGNSTNSTALAAEVTAAAGDAGAGAADDVPSADDAAAAAADDADVARVDESGPTPIADEAR
eukprot:INCI19678.2.p1 GENE.INCI19678.2~~INCI19678.2.p1  ORF type:complete len:482 (-),score=102.60 INCI19678.2:147-1592(-)